MSILMVTVPHASLFHLFIWYEYLYIHAHTYRLITAQPIISMERMVERETTAKRVCVTNISHI